MSISAEFIRALDQRDGTGLAVYQARADASQVYERFSRLADTFKNTSERERTYHNVLNELARASANDLQLPQDKLRLVTGTLVKVIQYYPDRVGDLFDGYQPIFNTTKTEDIPFPDDINLGAYATKFEQMVLLVLESKRKGERLPVNYAQIMKLFAESKVNKTAAKK